MRKRMLASFATAAVLAGAGLSCNDDPTGPGAVAQVLINAPIRTVNVGGTIQLEGRAATTQAIRVDELVTWAVSDPNVISLEAELTTVAGNTVNIATVTGLSAGSSDVTASAQGKSHTVKINVTAPPN